MAKYSTKEIMKPGFQLPSDYNELVSVYRTLAKTADQRLVRLESYAYDENMGNVLQWAYARAQRDIEQWSGSEAKRFNTAPPTKKQSLIAKIKDIQTFIEAPSSTKQGIKNVYQKRAQTINEKYGTNLTWENIGDFFESEMYKKLEDKYGSDLVLKVLAAIDKSKKEQSKAKKMQEEANKSTKDKTVVKIADDDILQRAVDEVIAQYSDDIKEFLK